MPHKKSAQNSNAWGRPRAGQTERKSSAHVKTSSVRNAQRMKHSFQSDKSDDRERDTRIDDHPAVLDEPKDHAVAECHVVLETTGEPQRQRIPETRRSEARHKQQTTLL